METAIETAQVIDENGEIEESKGRGRRKRFVKAMGERGEQREGERKRG